MRSGSHGRLLAIALGGAGVLQTFAQTQKNGAVEALKVQSQVSEPERMATIRETLGGLLAKFGIKVKEGNSPSDSSSHRRIMIRWQGVGSSGSTANSDLRREATPGVLKLLALHESKGVLPHDRTFDLSAHQILVVAMDKSYSLLWWKLILDPRLLRSETSSGTGELTRSEDYYRSQVDFELDYPDDRTITELRFYHPVWNGENFDLELLSNLPLT